MEQDKKIKFPSGFFEKSRPKVTKNSQFEDIIPLNGAKRYEMERKKHLLRLPKKI